MTSSTVAPRTELGPREYLGVLHRRRWLLVAALVAALAASLAMSALQEPVYEAEAQMLVLTRGSDTIFDSRTPTLTDPVRAVQNEIQVLEGDIVAAKVQTTFALADRPPDVHGAAIGATDVVAVIVRSTDRTTARLLADAYVQAYIAVKREQSVESLVAAGAELQKKVTEIQSQIEELDRQVAEAPEDERTTLADSLAGQRRTLVDQQALFEQRLDQLQVDAALASGGAQVVRTAEQPDGPIDPTPLRSAALALLLGLLIGLVGVFVVDHLDDTLRSSDDLERATALPTLAVIPVDASADGRSIRLDRPDDAFVEAMRRLRTNLQFVGLDSPLRVVQLTSPMPGEGKSTATANLALMFAQAGVRTVVVDADLRRPRLHLLFDVDPTRGLTTALLGESVEQLVRPVSDRLDVLTAGPVPANPSEVLGGPAMKVVVERLASRYDLVLMDSAPLLPVADSVGLAAVVDGVILVTQSRRTSVAQLQLALRQLHQVQAPVVGTVLNRVTRRSSADGDAYGYVYGYGATSSSRSAMGGRADRSSRRGRRRSQRTR